VRGNEFVSRVGCEPGGWRATPKTEFRTPPYFAYYFHSTARLRGHRVRLDPPVMRACLISLIYSQARRMPLPHGIECVRTAYAGYIDELRP
jgi:hypothetical protein